MTVTSSTRPGNDILTGRWATAFLYGLPSAVIVASGVTIRSPLVSFDLASPWRGVIWAAAMGVMATACLVNAARCGRIHCYFTGPLFILTAVASLGYGLGALPLGPEGWNIIGLIALVGAALLMWLPEAVFGKYRAPRGTPRRPPGGIRRG